MNGTFGLSSTGNYNSEYNYRAQVGPSLFSGLNGFNSNPGPSAFALAVSGQQGTGLLVGINPGGLGSLQPGRAVGGFGNGDGGRQDGYIQGLEDALKQVHGPKSKPDEDRIRGLLEAARQSRNSNPGSGAGPAPGPGAGSGVQGHHRHGGCGCHHNSGSGFGGDGANFNANSANSGSGGRGPEWSQGYTQGIEAALGQIRGKQSKPDEDRVRALLEGARQQQQQPQPQLPREAMFGSTDYQSSATPFGLKTPSLFGAFLVDGPPLI